MPRILKIFTIAAAAVLSLLLVLIAVLAATFDPNAYKSTAIALVQERTGRTLQIPGTIKLSFFPKIGAELGKVSLSERGSATEFLAVDSARVSLALLPLLHKTVVVDRIAVQGLRATLVRNADGSSNVDDLTAPHAEGAKTASTDISIGDRKPVLLDIDSIDIGNASVHVDDRKLGRQIELDQFTLQSGRIASGVPGHLSLSARVKLNHPQLDTTIAFKTDFTIDLDNKRFVLKGLDADVNGALPGYDKALLNLKGGIDLDLGGQHVAAPELLLSFEGKNAGMNLGAKLNAALDADLKTGKIDLTVKGKLDDSTIEARLGMHNLAAPAFDFTVNIDSIDLARYQSAGKAPAPAAGAPEGTIDLSGLHGLNANGSVHIGALKAAGMQASAVGVELHAGGNKLALAPLTATLYQGSMNGAINLDFSASASTPHITVTNKLSAIHIGPLLKDALKKDIIDGTGDVQLNVNTQGATLTQMRRALAGQASFRLADGAVSGFNLSKIIREAKAALGGSAGSKSGAGAAGDKTDFSELSASLHIAGGVAHNDDLLAKTPLFRLGGAGDIDLGREQLDYLLKCTVVASLEGQGGPELQALKGLTVPVRLDGPLKAIAWHIDFKSMIGDTVKKKAEEKVKDKVKDALKGLFGH